MFRSFVAVESKARRQTLENKILYLIQLWADTFMMYENSYPHFLSTYRLLRKEGVIFPPRETSTRFMLSSLNLESPMFDYLEEKSQKPKNPMPFDETKATQKGEKEFNKFVGGPMELVNRGENLATVILSEADIEVIKNYMQLVDDICVNAEELKDIKTDIGLQVYKYTQAVYVRCISIINAKVERNIEFQLDMLLTLSEDLDVRVKLFRNTFVGLIVKEEATAAGVSLEDIRKSSKDPVEEKVKVHKKRRAVVKPLPPPPSNQFFQFETKQSPLIDLLEEFDNREEVKEANEPKGIVKDLLDLQLDDHADRVTVETKDDTQGKAEDNPEDNFFEDLANRKE